MSDQINKIDSEIGLNDSQMDQIGLNGVQIDQIDGKVGLIEWSDWPDNRPDRNE